MNVRTFLIALVIAAALGGGYTYYSGIYSSGSSALTQDSAPTEIRTTPRSPMSSEQAAKVKILPLAPEIESILSQQIGILAALGIHQEFIKGVRAANEENSGLSAGDITRLDEEWLASKNAGALVQKLMSNDIAKQLLSFQGEHQNFREIFVTDSRGLNIGLTNKTSDYYQADESWWAAAYSDGAGKPFHGNIEFDQSSQTEAISIYVPVISGGVVIGVIKGVTDLSYIRSKL